MIKLSANMSKKVPILGQDYSSQQYGAAVEVEMADGADPGLVRRRLHDLYRTLAQAVDEQIGAAETVTNSDVTRAQRQNGSNGKGRGNGSNGGKGRTLPPASDAQLRAIRRICDERGIDAHHYLSRPLNIREASDLIDNLKSSRAAS